ncbi:putative undecaprenyl-phosphate N-acetylglucosaminyl 1-phosphate transferase [Tepidimonas thermarum]|uniref:Putative undecaprenyl-phosphate N-acetylglucosaminyl 1-phosphate transferase n=1 Tax=Tepidimonas thermarum TaxID=335431 RepID=A0A554WYW2_9BURK|nr:glycosyltransferase [Tepidimonas thermarum]TSE28748.1 putative undecaprenyl-phosphate N-acetylglucosaminyl 1-phosphate transferase [Tepidimonas thermarum]
MLTQLILSFLVSAVAAGWLVRDGRRYARHYPVDAPQRFHVGDVPRLGGVAMLVALVVVSARQVHPVWGDLGRSIVPWAVWLAVMGTLLPAVLGGVFEDLTHRLAPLPRLALTGLSATLAVVWLGLSIDRSGFTWFDTHWQALPWLGMALAWLAVAGLPHAFNLIDGYNGLAGAVALAVTSALAYVALKVGDWPLAALLSSLAGATAGFLVWNYPRGLLFAGDGGAYLWGCALAVASVALVQRNPAVSPWFPMLLLAYPVVETLFSVYRKAVRGDSPGVADALHFHQLIYRRIVRGVFHDDAARQLLMRNNRTSPYLWGFALTTVIPAVLFWDTTPVLMVGCVLFVLAYVAAYLTIVRFKVPRWLRR